MTKAYFEPIHLKTYYKKEFGCKTGDLPITEDIADKVLSLPIYPTLNNKEIDYICNSIKEVFWWKMQNNNLKKCSEIKKY